MNLLLDTHIALWSITEDPKLSAYALELISSPENTVWVSSVNVCEISIKNSRRKKLIPISGRKSLDFFRRAGYLFLSVEPQHTVFVEELPDLHRDPFDRLLVAQALAEPMRLITHDSKVAQYNNTIILV